MSTTGPPEDRPDLPEEPAGPDAPEPRTPAPRAGGRIGLVLTPVASAPALAGLCAMSGIDVGVVPTSSGAVAVIELPAQEPPEDWDVGELLGAPETGAPDEAVELARTLSRLGRTGVVLLTADLGKDVGIESGLSGQVQGRRYVGGQDAGDVAPGLVIATADQVVEDLVLGRVRPQAAPGYQRSGELPRWKAARMLAKGLRRRRA